MKKLFLSAAALSVFPLLFGAFEGFENPTGPYNIRRYVGYKHQPDAEGMKTERSTLKVSSGKYALELNCTRSDATHHFNYFADRPDQQGGIQLKFRYFIAESEGNTGVSGRIMQLDAQGKHIKPLSFFTSPAKSGVWQTGELTVFPKPECRKLIATIWFRGKMRVYLDDVFFGIPQAEKKSGEYAQILSDSAAGVWFAAPADRKIRYQGIPEQQSKGGVLKFKGAKGEKSARLLALNPKRKFGKLELKISDPKLFRVNVLEFIEMKNPDNPAMKGFHSDPLLNQDFSPAAPGRNTVFCVEARIPFDAPAGVQKGTISLIGDGKELACAPYELTIRQFALPEHPEFKTYMPVRGHRAFRAFGKRSVPMLVQDMLELCSAEQINPQGGLDPYPPKFEIQNGKVIASNWERFDSDIDRLVKIYDFREIRLPVTMFGANGGWFLRNGAKEPMYMGESLLNGKGLDYLCQVIKLYTDHLQQKYPKVTAYAYLYDEPPAHLLKDVKRIASAVHKVAPACKIYMTGGNGHHFIDDVYAFCVPLAPGHLWSTENRAKLKDSQEMWYYNWDASLASHVYQRNRLYPWLCYTANGCGGLAWHSNHCGPLDKPVNPWLEMEKTYNAGYVTVFYPPRTQGDKVSGSLRLRHRGQSLSDYAYLKLLERAIDKEFPGKGRARVMELLTEVIPVPPFKWLNDADKITALHERIGDEIENFAQAPKALLVTNPAENSKCILSEIKLTLHAEPGTKITASDGKTYTAGQGGVVQFTQLLSLLGENTLVFTLSKDGKSKKIFRKFTLLPDPELVNLKKIAASAADKALVEKAEKSVYTAGLKKQIATRLKELKNSRLNQQLAEAKKLNAPLCKALVNQAELCIKWQLPERAGYYLNLVQNAAAAKSKAVKVTPFVQNEHFGIELDNGIISARFLETGGRLISFKVKGVETFARPEWKQVLPPRDRALRQPSPDIVMNLPEYGGMEDASGNNNRWIISAVDWDMELIELAPNRAVIGFSTIIPGTPFKIRRAATLEANSDAIRFDYTITNTAPPEMKSEDPASFHFPWRLRLLPGIGADGAAHDKLKVPSAKTMAADTMSTTKKLFFSGLYPLSSPAIGAYDANEQCGFVLSGSKTEVGFAYCWFDDSSRRSYPLYTLEILRSYLLTAPGSKDGNKPFSIQPGQEYNFRIFLRGVKGSEEEWQKKF